MRTLLAAVLLAIVATASRAELPVYAAVEDMHADAARRVAARQFEGLVADADRYLKTEERFADGRWKLAVLWWGIDNALEHGGLSRAQWAADEAAAAALANKRPESPNAWLMLAAMEYARGWAARGNGCGCDLDQGQADGFEQHLQKARALLAAHPAPANPAWYAERLSIEGDLGAEPAALDTLFAQAIQRAPGYQQTWFTRLHYLEPKWGGSLDAMARFIRRGAVETSTGEGHGMMARLLWTASKEGYNEPLTDPQVGWDAVKVAFDDVLARYPDDWNAQWFFMQACRHGDRPEAAHLLAWIKHGPSSVLFEPAGVPFGDCVDWANGRTESFTLFDPDTGEPRTIR